MLAENQKDEHLSKMTFEEYVNSIYYDKTQHNLLTRSLADTAENENTTREDLNQAMGIINQKFIVGLSSNVTSTLERFEKYFQWKYSINPTVQEQCRNAILSTDTEREEVEEESESESSNTNSVYEKIKKENSFDVELYNYVKSLYVEQAQFVDGVQDGFRMSPDIATCAKCVPPTFPRLDNFVDSVAAVPVLGMDLSFKAPVIEIPSFDGFKGKLYKSLSIHVLSISY